MGSKRNTAFKLETAALASPLPDTMGFGRLRLAGEGGTVKLDSPLLRQPARTTKNSAGIN